ncbi:MAG: Fe-S protein assembly chaperone HscA [Flavobacteriales bacterium]|nr:Fe-S protein assembly chaperone HscA [Flavobacteriales bacterium]
MARVPINLNTGKIEKKEVIIGIDLGTTNSLVAAIDPANGRPHVLRSGNSGLLVPSVVYFDEQDRCVVGASALVKLETEPERTIYSAKRLMGRSFHDIEDHRHYFSYEIIETDEAELVKVRIGSHFFSPIELSAEILKELKYRAESALGQAVRKAVITVPAYFNDTQRQATRDAGRLAGLEVLRILNEPTAASLAYGIGLNEDQTRTVAVYDLGGGTFDISILRIEDGIYDVLSTHGDTYLGGDDIDRAIVKYWLSQYPKSSGINDHQLRLAAEKIKKLLSEQEDASVEIDGISLELDRNRFNALIQPILEKTIVSCKQAVADSGLSIKDIDEVALVGGSTRIPLVRDIVGAFFSESHLNTDLDPDKVVALGAAVEADILAGNRKDTLLLDVTPLSLGIETMGGLMDVIITRNSNIPTNAAKNYTTSVDGQVNLKIAVFQGERDVVSENRKLAEFELQGIPAMPAGLPKIQVTFQLDANGILQVKAEELRSGVKQEVLVQPQNGLSDLQIEEMLAASLMNAKDDMAFRALTEARNEAENLILSAEKFLKNYAGELNESENDRVVELVDQLRAFKKDGSKDEILEGIERLNKFTRPFAEKLMDIAVASALKGRSI